MRRFSGKRRTVAKVARFRGLVVVRVDFGGVVVGGRLERRGDCDGA